MQKIRLGCKNWTDGGKDPIHIENGLIFANTKCEPWRDDIERNKELKILGSSPRRDGSSRESSCIFDKHLERICVQQISTICKNWTVLPKMLLASMRYSQERKVQLFPISSPEVCDRSSTFLGEGHNRVFSPNFFHVKDLTLAWIEPGKARQPRVLPHDHYTGTPHLESKLLHSDGTIFILSVGKLWK